jgi:hypothetical protein
VDGKVNIADRAGWSVHRGCRYRCKEDAAGGREWDGAPAVYLQWVTHL